MDSAQLSTLLTDLVQALVALLVAFAIAWIRRHMSVQQFDLARSLAEIAVSAIEQMAAAGQIDPAAKKRAAIERVRAMGERVGVRLSYDQWVTLIEAAVLEMKGAGDELKRPPPVYYGTSSASGTAGLPI